MIAARLGTHTSRDGGRSMRQVKREFGKLNPKAPRELSRFAFLIGNWRFEARVESSDGKSHFFQGTWAGRYILDGRAIADEYRMTDKSRRLVVLGVNLRAYDASKKTWNMKWLNGLTGTWTNLTPPELGGVTYNRRSITYAFKELAPIESSHAYTRATYTSHAKSRFTWRGEKSSDRKAWSEFMVVECRRDKR
jgi:hypothetical protein